MSLPGVEPGLRPSQSRVHPPHSRDRNQNALTQIAFRLPLGCRQSLFPAEESNLARLLRRQSCILHTRRAFFTTADPTRRLTNLVYLFQLHYAERAGVEPARGFRPQSISNRCPAPIGRPFRYLFNASTRTRTWNIPLEAGGDFRFTTETYQKRKARDSNPHPPCGRAALAVRSGQPYPATFRIQAFLSFRHELQILDQHLE